MSWSQEVGWKQRLRFRPHAPAVLCSVHQGQLLHVTGERSFSSDPTFILTRCSGINLTTQRWDKISTCHSVNDTSASWDSTNSQLCLFADRSQNLWSGFPPGPAAWFSAAVNKSNNANPPTVLTSSAFLSPHSRHRVLLSVLSFHEGSHSAGRWGGGSVCAG